MMKAATAFLFALSLSAVSAQDMPSEVAKIVPQPEMLGQSSTRILGITLYEGQLFTSQGADFSYAEPFALTLTYRRNFSGAALAKATIDEIARIEGADQSDLQSLIPLFENCFPDVAKGERITATGPKANTIEVYKNGTRTCRAQDAGLRKRFFDIWLSAQSRDPQGAAQLKGS
ncbi:MAG: chalcone isomerase family protein [Pseudomonadota bacterium]